MPVQIVTRRTTTTFKHDIKTYGDVTAEARGIADTLKLPEQGAVRSQGNKWQREPTGLSTIPKRPQRGVFVMILHAAVVKNFFDNKSNTRL